MNELKPYLEYILDIKAQGGPLPEDYEAFYCVIEQVAKFNPPNALIEKVFGDILTPDTFMGRVFHAPEGYPGDYILMEKIYRMQPCPEPFTRWDKLILDQPASQAVKNRLHIFTQVLYSMNAEKVIDIGCGSGRGILTALEKPLLQDHKFLGIDIDPHAIAFANKLLVDYPQATFQQREVVGFRTREKVDLIWAAGLFDYVDDRVFVRLIQRFMTFLNPGGQLIIGNFDPSNPQKVFMDMFGWKLIHRTQGHLLNLAQGYDASCMADQTGINNFLMIERT